MTVPEPNKKLAPKSPQVQRPMALSFAASGLTYLILKLAEGNQYIADAVSGAFGGIENPADQRTAMTAVILSLIVGAWAKLRQLRYRQVVEKAKDVVDDIRDIFDGDDDEDS